MELLCRACLRNNTQASYFLFENSLGKYFTDCTSLLISPEDGYPANVCHKCYTLLKSFNSFKERCLKSHKLLEEKIFELNHYSENKLHLIEENKLLDLPDDTEAREDLSKKINRKQCRKQESSKSYDCRICHTKFSHKAALNNHSKTHKVGIEKKYYNCTKCDKWFFTEERLLGHLRTHEGKKQAECKLCGKDFLKWSGLKQHMIQHEGSKKYCCQYCSKQFFFEWALKSHEKKHSSPDSSMLAVCEKCGKSFTSVGNLKIHLQVHSEERPYRCPQCGNHFKQEGNLKDHILRHNGIKNHVCSVCGKAFTTQSEHDMIRLCVQDKTYAKLVRHTALHSDDRPFSCDQCGRCFKRKPLLVNHLKTHTGQKKHKCHICQKSFSSSTTLTEHKRTHTGEKPHICSFCNRAFAQKTVLRNHAKSCLKKYSFPCTTAKPYNPLIFSVDTMLTANT